MLHKDEYLTELKKRAKESHVYRGYQLIGLEIARLLNDEKHKALYIKLAKEKGNQRMLELAKSVAEKTSVRNKGAYFMTCLKDKIMRKNGSLSLRKSNKKQKNPKIHNLWNSALKNKKRGVQK